MTLRKLRLVEKLRSGLDPAGCFIRRAPGRRLAEDAIGARWPRLHVLVA